MVKMREFEEGADNISTMLGKITLAIEIVIALVVIIAVVVLFFYLKARKGRKERRFMEEEYGYSGLNRVNAKDYLKFDDICNDMVVMENGKRFMGAIICERGLDFYSAHVSQKVGCQSGYRSFISTINQPIAFWQYSASVNLDHTQQKYETAYKQRQEELFNLNEEREEGLKLMKRYESELGEEAVNSNEYILVMEAITKTQEKMEHVKWRIIHLEDQLFYIKQLKENYGCPKRPQIYFFDWYYDPQDFPVDLTKEEIYQRAQDELYSIAETKIHALSNAGVKFRRATGEELEEFYYQHFHPFSSKKLPLKKLKEESGEFIIGTTQKNVLEQAAREEVAYESLKDIQKATEDILNEAS